MQITFHGAAQTVTGSKHLITTDDGIQILLDCGLFQGMGDETDDLNENLGFNPSEVNYLILSHAHIDHCGLIPALIKKGFGGPIYCTAPTMALARILLLDSAKIQSQDAEFENRHNLKDIKAPLYDEDDVIKAISLFKIVEYNEEFEISNRISLLFTDAGHIVGSAAVHLKILEKGVYKNLTFSGDIGRYSDALLKSPQVFEQAEYILLESTYGDSLHSEIAPIEDQLLDIINQTCIIKGGKIIIPAFSVGRTQEILYALNLLEEQNRLPDIPVYVDSPLSAKATQVLKDHPEVFNKNVQEVMKTDDDIFQFKGLKFIESSIESKALNQDNRPCVIIASSGMADSGRVKHHIKNNISNTKNTILIVGYCEPKSLGGKLAAKNPYVHIFGEEYKVEAEVKVIKSMSAHGDYQDLIKFLSCQDPQLVQKLFLVHGEIETQEKFKKRLSDISFTNIYIPYLHQNFNL